MSTAEIVPGQSAEGFEQDPRDLLQADADIFFSERAKHILPTRLGRLVVGPRNISDRPYDDITLLGQYLIPSDTSQTDDALHKFSGMVSNVRQTSEEFDLIIEQHKLNDPKYSNLLIVAPHTSMPDILGLAYLSHFTTLGKDRTANDNYMYLSRLLGYAEQKKFRKPNVQLVNDRILPITNVVQVFPETKSTEKLVEKHSNAVGKANLRAKLAMMKHQKEQGDSEKQGLIFIAPTGSQMKRFKKGKKTEPISESTMKLMYDSYESNTPVLVMGFELNIALALSKFMGKQAIRFAAENTIMPEENLSREEFEVILKSRLLSVARQVSKKHIYA